MSVMLSATNCMDWICKVTNSNINDAFNVMFKSDLDILLINNYMIIKN